MSPANTPVVFVHGQWLHATSWDPWVDLFREAGYAPLAPGWPGDADTVEETRRQPDRVAGKGIDDVVAHYAQIIRGLERDDLFTVAFDQVMTDTAFYADVVLPATTFLEAYDFAKAYGPIHIDLGRPVVDAVGEARSNADVFGELDRKSVV